MKANGLTIHEIFDYIKSEGFLPCIDKDDGVEFKCQGEKYFVRLQDNNYVQLSCAYRLAVNRFDMTGMMQAAMQVMWEIRACKIVLISDAIVFSIETYVSSLSGLAEHFNIYLDIIMASMKLHGEYYERILDTAGSSLKEQQATLAERFGIC